MKMRENIYDEEKKRWPESRAIQMKVLHTNTLPSATLCAFRDGLRKEILRSFSCLKRIFTRSIDLKVVNRRLRALNRRLDKRDALLKSPWPEKLNFVLQELIVLAEQAKIRDLSATPYYLEVLHRGIHIFENEPCMFSGRNRDFTTVLFDFYARAYRLATDPNAIRSAERYLRQWYDSISGRRIAWRKEETENLLECVCGHISLYPDTFCHEDTLNILLNILTKNMDLASEIIKHHDRKHLLKFIDVIAQWIRHRVPSHRLCYLFAALVFTLGDTSISYYKAETSSRCILGIENPHPCDTTYDNSLLSEDTRATIRNFVRLHNIRTVLNCYGTLPEMLELPNNFSIGRTPRSVLEHQIVVDLLATFPASNAGRRWRFDVPVSLRETMNALRILEALGELDIDVVAQCVLMSGCSIHSDNYSSEVEFDPELYCWGLRLFRALSLQRPHLDSLWSDSRIFGRFLSWLDLDEKEFIGVQDSMTWHVLDPDGRWVWEDEFTWMELCHDIMPFLQQQLKKVLRERMYKGLKNLTYVIN